MFSLNITPDETGIEGWTAADVRTVIKTGVDTDGNHLCPPMPFGPMGAFGGMTDAHAQAIGEYVTRLPPIENELPDGGGPIPKCILPPPPDGGADAGADASADASLD